MQPQPNRFGLVTRIFTVGLSGVLAGALLSRVTAETPQAPDAYDIVIRNGRVLDGTGNPWIRADIGIRAGRIVAIGRLGTAKAHRTIDAADRYVTSGFIDVHSHAAEGLTRPALRQAQPLLAQGITTIVVNPDGGGPEDLAAQRAELESGGIGVNVALLIGHGTVRRAVLGMADRAPGDAELDAMRELVRRAMADGAFGLSSGLFYAPGSYATTEEVIALAEVVSESGGLYTSHIRDESDYTVGLVAAVDEVIRIAEAARVPGIVSHMKALGPGSWGLSVAATMRIDAARARGIEVFADQYPYEASSTSVTGALIPRWAQTGGDEALRARIADPALRPKLLEAVRQNLRRRGGPQRLVVSRFEADPALEGRDLADIASARGRTPEEAALDLVVEGGASLVSFNMSERDIEEIMPKPYTMTSTDGGLVAMGEGRPHPRNYGAFARKLARYAGERRTIDLESAIRSMTSLPASVFRMRDRGVLREGAWADILLFDPAQVRDRASYRDPHQLAAGIDDVLVNGVVVREGGRFTDALPGRVLRR